MKNLVLSMVFLLSTTLMFGHNMNQNQNNVNVTVNAVQIKNNVQPRGTKMQSYLIVNKLYRFCDPDVYVESHSFQTPKGETIVVTTTTVIYCDGTYSQTSTSHRKKTNLKQ